MLAFVAAVRAAIGQITSGSMSISAVVTDLDGTFWARDMSIHPETHRAVERLDAAGVPLLVATGRRALGALSGLAPAGYGDRPGIAMNGAIVRDQLDGPSFLVEPIEASAVDEMFGIFEASGLEPLVYVDRTDADMIVGAAPAAGAGYLESAPGVERHPTTSALRSQVQREVVIGLGAFGFPEAQIQPVADEVNARSLATAIVSPALFENGYGLMIQGLGIDKWTGIVAWCERHDLDPGRIAALGDGMNDIDMMTHAHVAIAPNNAVEAVLAIADHHIEPNENGGWSPVPDLLGL